MNFFKIFEKNGGEFICNYQDNTGTFIHECKNYDYGLFIYSYCKNLKSAESQLDKFLESSMYTAIFKETKLIGNESVKQIHHYQNMSLKELSIRFTVDEYGRRDISK